MDAANYRPVPVSPFIRRGAVRPFHTVSDVALAVTDADVDRAAARAVAMFRVQHESLRFSMWMMGLLPTAYGVLTWMFGDDLWAASPIYRTAMAMPYAPQSWGTLFIILGVLSILFGERRMYAATIGCCAATAVVLASFMTSFLVEFAVTGVKAATPPAIVYGIFALMFMDRARQAWKFRKIGP